MRALHLWGVPLIGAVTGRGAGHRFSPWPTSCGGARWCSTSIPTEEEVREAYRILGATPTSTFADVKKRYGELAKQHHPDVAAGAPSTSGNTDRMASINQAYTTASRFHKAGRTLSPPTSSSSSSQGSSYQSEYRPWHEDVDPLLYEMMWEQMRRQNDEEAFQRAMHAEKQEWSYTQSGWDRQPRGNSRSQRRRQRESDAKARNTSNKSSNKNNNSSNNNNNNGNGNGNSQGKQTDSSSESDNWDEATSSALLNMYQDGKSFDFIANALGKSVPQVLAHFNRKVGSSNNRSKRRSSPPRRKQAARWRGGPYDGGPWAHYAEDMELPEMEGYEDFDEFEGDDIDPYGYGAGMDDPYAPGAVPFRGAHMMSGSAPYNRNGYRPYTKKTNKKQ